MQALRVCRFCEECFSAAFISSPFFLLLVRLLYRGGFALSSDILLAQYDACIDFAIAVIRGDIERQISTKCQSEIRL